MAKKKFTKVQELLGSIRFWMITVAALLEIASQIWGDTSIINIIQVWLVAVTGVGTLDSVATKIRK